MQLDFSVLFAGGGVLVAIALSYGDLRARLRRMEKMLGNGEPGVFVRRSEHQELERRVGVLEDR